MILFLPRVFKLNFSHNIVQYFPEDNPYRRSLEYVDENLNGTITLEVVVDTGRENGLYDPQVLGAIEMANRRFQDYQHPDIHVGKVFSLTDIVKETHQALNENHPDAFRVPQKRDVIAQELFLFENSGASDLGKVVDSQSAITRLTIKTPWVDSVIFGTRVGR